MKLRPSPQAPDGPTTPLERSLQRQILAALRPPRPNYTGPPVRVGFDAEWVTRINKKGQPYNEVLCVSAVLDCAGRRVEHVYYLEGGKRPSLSQLLNLMLRRARKQGVVDGVPAEVTFYGHFLRGDVSALADFWERRQEFQGLGRTLTSGPAGHGVEVDSEAEEQTGAKPQVADDVVIRLGGGQRYSVRAYFLDTIRLTPGQRGLAYAAELISRKKLDLHADLNIPETSTAERPEVAGEGLEPRYGIGRMDLVLRDFPEAFEAYALEDARIALDFGLFMEAFARDELGLPRLPRTLSGCAAAACRLKLGGKAEVAALLGREMRTRKLFAETAHGLSDHHRGARRRRPAPLV